MANLLSYGEVSYFCQEFRHYYLGLCNRDHNNKLSTALLYRRGIEEEICRMLGSFAEAVTNLNDSYRECLFSFAPFQWQIYGIEEFLANGLSFPSWRSDTSRGHADYVLSELGTAKVKRYADCYAKYIKAQKRVQTKMIRFALEKGQEPIIRYEEVLEYAKNKLAKGKGDAKLKAAVEMAESENSRYRNTGMANVPTTGNYYFK